MKDQETIHYENILLVGTSAIVGGCSSQSVARAGVFSRSAWHELAKCLAERLN